MTVETKNYSGTLAALAARGGETAQRTEVTINVPSNELWYFEDTMAHHTAPTRSSQPGNYSTHVVERLDPYNNVVVWSASTDSLTHADGMTSGSELLPLGFYASGEPVRVRTQIRTYSSYDHDIDGGSWLLQARRVL